MGKSGKFKRFYPVLLKNGRQTDLGINGMVAQLGAVGGVGLGKRVEGSSYSGSVLTLGNIIKVCLKKIILVQIYWSSENVSKK